MSIEEMKRNLLLRTNMPSGEATPPLRKRPVSAYNGPFCGAHLDDSSDDEPAPRVKRPLRRVVVIDDDDTDDDMPSFSMERALAGEVQLATVGGLFGALAATRIPMPPPAPFMAVIWTGWCYFRVYNLPCIFYPACRDSYVWGLAAERETYATNPVPKPALRRYLFVDLALEEKRISQINQLMTVPPPPPLPVATLVQPVARARPLNYLVAHPAREHQRALEFGLLVAAANENPHTAAIYAAVNSCVEHNPGTGHNQVAIKIRRNGEIHPFMSEEDAVDLVSQLYTNKVTVIATRIMRD